jgi:trimeric autotransporter adhesin
MGKIELDHTGSGGGITLSSDGTDLLLDGTAIGGGLELYAENPSTPTAPSATGTNAIAVGDGSTATDTYSIAIGPLANAGSYAIALGYNADASGSSSFAGYDGTASGSSSIAIGGNSVASGTSSMALSYGTDATGDFSTAVGRNAQARASSANAFGRDAWSAGSQSTAIGDAYASGADSFAAAIANNTSSYGATGANSVAIGYQNIANDPNAVAIGKSNISSGSQTSIAIGQSNNVTGMRGVAIGSSNTVSGLIGHAYGDNNTVSGQYAVAFNRDNDAASNYSFVSGYYADSHGVKGRFARGTGGLSLNGTKGDAQYGLLVLVKNTTDATQTALSTDTLTAGSDNQLVVQNNGAVSFHGTIVAKQAGSSNVAAWEVKGLMHNVTTATLVNSAITVIDNTPGWGLAMAADTTNDAVQFLVTGAASTNISWVATIHSSEVIRS